MNRPIPRFTEAVTLNFSSHMTHDHNAIIPDVGTQVTVEYFNGEDYTPLTAKVTEPDTVFVRGCKVRFTPDKGGFYIDTKGGTQ